MVHKCMLRTDSISHLPKIFPDAPWHARWKRRFRKLFLVSINHPEVRVKRFLTSKAAVEKESRRHVKHFSPSIIHPLSEFRKFWNIFIFFLLFLHQMITPFATGFFLELQDSEWKIGILITFDLFVCVIVFVEILITIRTGYIVEETNEIILDPKKIIQKNFKTLIADSISCIPFIFLAFHVIEDDYGTINDSAIAYICCLYCFSFYRFQRIMKYFSSIPIMMNMSETGAIVLKLCLRTIT